MENFNAIRDARLEDLPAIKRFLAALDYRDTDMFLEERMKQLMAHPDARLLVYMGDHGEVAGFVSLHFIPQIALEGDFMRLNYLAVDENYRNRGIGREIEAYCTDLAIQRGCDRIELHSHRRRTDAHRFYFRLGYTDSPKYLIKSLKTKQ